jgi:hypothetical protein
MWTDIVCGLFPVGDIYYSQANRYSRRRKRTFVVEIVELLHFGRFFRWIEGKRWKAQDKTCQERIDKGTKAMFKTDCV